MSIDDASHNPWLGPHRSKWHGFDQNCCIACHQVLQSTLFDTSEAFVPGWIEHVYYRSLGELKNSPDGCGLCCLLRRLVFDVMIPGIERYETDYSLHNYYFSSTHITLQGYRGTLSSRSDQNVLHISAVEPSTSAQKEFTLVAISEDIDDVHGNRLINPERADAGQIRSWVQLCEYEHHDICDSRQTESIGDDVQALVVVDVQDHVLRLLPPGARYMALSYVWGQTKEPRRYAEDDFRADNPWAIPSDLPRTLQDAIALVREIGERFIWIDALCISPDPRQRANEVASMHKVYNGAFLTIIAADGADSEAGLRCLFSGRWNSMKKTPLSADVCGRILAVTTPIPSHELFTSKWNSRGWTLQERLFSRRMIVFVDDEVFWHCKCATMFEDVSIKKKAGYGSSRFSADVVRGLDSLMPHRSETIHSGVKDFQWLIQEYSQRHLTFDSDAFAAIASAMTVLGSIMETRIIYGLPENSFYESLLWWPKADDQAWDYLSRDRAIEMTRRAGWPSWSWLGWKGSVDTYPNYYAVRSSNTVIRSLVCWTRSSDGFVSPVDTQLTMPELPRGLDHKALSAHHLVCYGEYVFLNQVLKRRDVPSRDPHPEASRVSSVRLDEQGRLAEGIAYTIYGGQSLHGLSEGPSLPSDTGFLRVLVEPQSYKKWQGRCFILAFRSTGRYIGGCPVASRLGVGYVFGDAWADWPVQRGFIVME
jgi:hypothetical protein